MKILAIETSCDETAASIVEAVNFRPVVRTDIIASQIAAHAETGGVVPDIAARMHSENLPTVLRQATESGKLEYDAVAVTTGPGLVGCLLLGMAAAKTIAATTGRPFFAINHLEGHIYSAWLGETSPELPALILIVSGGHTELIYMPSHLRYQHLGATRDDAAGEAFDKVARLLGLSYPGGPAISQLANEGDPEAYQFPISFKDEQTFDFSFSGLKASVANLVNKLPQPLAKQLKADIAASFQKTVGETLSQKLITALQSFPETKSVAFVGGVAANHHLRVKLEQTVNQVRPDCQFIVPNLEYCTDNAAMIGAAAVHHHLFGKPDNWYDAVVNPNQKLSTA